MRVIRYLRNSYSSSIADDWTKRVNKQISWHQAKYTNSPAYIFAEMETPNNSINLFLLVLDLYCCQMKFFNFQILSDMSFRVFTGRTTDNGQVFFPTFKLLEEGP